jgi:hypothetical protein
MLMHLIGHDMLILSPNVTPGTLKRIDLDQRTLTRTGAGGRYQCPSPHPTEWLDEWSWSFAARACDILAGARYNSQGLGARGRATMGIDMRQHAAAWARLS